MGATPTKGVNGTPISQTAMVFRILLTSLPFKRFVHQVFFSRRRRRRSKLSFPPQYWITNYLRYFFLLCCCKAKDNRKR